MSSVHRVINILGVIAHSIFDPLWAFDWRPNPLAYILCLASSVLKNLVANTPLSSFTCPLCTGTSISSVCPIAVSWTEDWILSFLNPQFSSSSIYSKSWILILDVLNPQFSSISSLVSLFFTLIDCHESSDFVKTHHSSLEFQNELKTESSSIHSVSWILSFSLSLD